VSALERVQARLENPILSLDLRTRMRGARAVVIQLVYLVVVLGFMAYAVWLYERGLAGTTGRWYGPDVSKQLYHFILITQAVVLCLLTPAFTAGGISIEREQQTLDMLLITRLSPAKLVWGRLLAAGGFAALLLLTSAPLLGICFLLGGVSPEEVGYSYVTLMLTALLFGGFGICASAYTQRTVAATIAAFLIALAYLTVTCVALITSESPLAGSAGPSGLVGLNPFGAIFFSAEPTTLFGLTMPCGLPSAVLLSLAVFVMPTLAIEKLAERHDPRPRPWSRVLLTLVVFMVPLVLLGWFLQIGASSSEAVSVYLIVVLGLVTLLLPIYTTGDGLKEHWVGLRTAVNPARWFRTGQPCGLLLGLLWMGSAVVVGGALGLLLPVSGKPPITVGEVAGMALVAGGFIVAYGLLALALSAWVRRKGLAAALTYALLVVALVVPAMVLAAHSGHSDSTTSRLGSFGLYLNPFVALAAIGFHEPTGGLRQDAPLSTHFAIVNLFMVGGVIVGALILLLAGLAREEDRAAKRARLAPTPGGALPPRRPAPAGRRDVGSPLPPRRDAGG